MPIPNQQTDKAPAASDLCERFEDALRRHERPVIDDWLREAGPLADEALPEFVALELEYRLEAGETATAAEYLYRFPALRADPEVAVRLVAAEFRSARERDASVNETRFRSRYPDLSVKAEWSNGPWVGLCEATGTLVQSQPCELPAPTSLDFPYNLLSPPIGPDEIGRLGEYRILGVLGEGGMGVVLKGEQISLSRPVALKLMKPDSTGPQARIRFEREAKAAAALEHPRIVIIYTVGELNGAPFIAMPLMRGQSLAGRLEKAKAKPLPLAEAIRYAREIAEGLAAAHAHKLIHRDVKPDNVWLEETGDGIHVRLLDFGLVRWDERERLTNTNAVLGTPAYMAPEQADARTVDARADLFSLGCVLYQMVTGQKPFSGPSMMAILLAVANYHPPSAGTLNGDVPAELSALIDRLLSKNPDGRPASAAQVVSALRTIESRPAENVNPVADKKPVARIEARKNPKWAHLRWIIGSGVVVAVIALAAWLKLPPRGTTDGAGPLPNANTADNEYPLPNAGISKFRIKAIELKHYQAIQGGKHQSIGLLGRDSFTPAQYDRVRIEVRLSRPGYGYLLAFRPDGKFDLCVPVESNQPPSLTDAIVYHPTEADTAYGLDEGTGLWVFAVVASEKQLPSFKEWQEKFDRTTAWKPTPAIPGTIWTDDGVWLEIQTEGGRHFTDRGLGAKLDGPEQSIKAITDWLRAAGSAEGVTVSAVGFGVGARK